MQNLPSCCRAASSSCIAAGSPPGPAPGALCRGWQYAARTCLPLDVTRSRPASCWQLLWNATCIRWCLLILLLAQRASVDTRWWMMQPALMTGMPAAACFAKEAWS